MHLSLTATIAIVRTQAVEWAASKGMQYFECSARESTNVEQAFTAVATHALRQCVHPTLCARFSRLLFALVCASSHHGHAIICVVLCLCCDHVTSSLNHDCRSHSL
jgi:hypothetical protein